MIVESPPVDENATSEVAFLFGALALWHSGTAFSKSQMVNSMQYFPAFLALTILIQLFPSPVFGDVEPFFSPPEKKGSITIKLYPMENVKPGVSTLVTFGMPFTRGSVTEKSLANVRIFNEDKTEIPAFVDQLTPWRNIFKTDGDLKSVRFARIQFIYTFSAPYPNYATVTVEWGVNHRTKTRREMLNPKTAWHRVESGSYMAGDSVFEPDVYAVLPKEYLCMGMIKPTRMLPLDRRVPETRETPDTFDVASFHPGYELMDHVQHNNFFTIINEDDSRVDPKNLCPYKTQFEPWLYDRSSSIYILYFRSGRLKELREAVRNTMFYKNNLYDDTTKPSRFTGLFRLKTPEIKGIPTGNNAMYSYNECLAYTYWLTCNDEVLNAVKWVVNAHDQNDEPTRWNPKLPVWTERHTAFHLLAHTVAYEITGETAYRDSIVSMYNAFIWHQNGAGGNTLPHQRVDGGLWHYGFQHEDGNPDSVVASSWMTAITVDAMLRVYALSEDRRIADFIRRVGAFEKAACKRDENHDYGAGPIWFCDYMIRYNGLSEVRTSGDMIDHSMEIGATAAWAAYFSCQLGVKDPSLIELADRLFDSYTLCVSHWITPEGPLHGNAAFRVTPWRKYGWEYRPSGSFTWLMSNLNGR